MSILTRLNIDGKQFNIIEYTYHIKQDVNYNGHPNSKPIGGLINLILESSKDDLFDEWAISPNMVKDVEIIMMSSNMDRPSKKIRLSGTYLINKEEIFNNTNNEPTKTKLILSPDIYEENTSVFNKDWKIGTLSSSRTPVTSIQDDKEEDAQVSVDIYIDSQTGHRFTEITPNTNTYRIIHLMDYEDVISEYPNRINSKEVIDKLKPLSQEVIIDDKKIQMIIQKVDTNSRISEFQMYIVLERNWIDPLNAPAIITAEEDHHTVLHDDGEIKMNIAGKRGKNGNIYYKSPKGNIVIAQVHGHNRLQEKNKINLPGTSVKDQKTSKFNRFNVYAIESYKNETGKQAVIAKTDGMGKETLNFALTIGHKIKGGNAGSGKGTVNIGKDAIDFYSKNPRKQ